MNDKRSEWEKVAILLSNDPLIEINCPKCGISSLEVKDIYNRADTTEFERIIYCKSCGAKTYLRMHKNE